MKSADVQLVTYAAAVGNQLFGRVLNGSRAACKAACNAFTDAVLDIACNLVQRA